MFFVSFLSFFWVSFFSLTTPQNFVWITIYIPLYPNARSLACSLSRHQQQQARADPGVPAVPSPRGLFEGVRGASGRWGQPAGHRYGSRSGAWRRSGPRNALSYDMIYRPRTFSPVFVMEAVFPPVPRGGFAGRGC